MSKVRFSFVCVNYEGCEHTKTMVLSLLNQTDIGHKFEINIVVVDNSPILDEEIHDYCKLHENVKYLRSDRNEGYFAALNMGIESLAQEKNKYVIVCNNDLEFARDFCCKLLQVENHDNVQVICPDVVTFDGIHQNPHHVAGLSRLKIFLFDCYFSNYFFAKALLQIKQISSKFNLGRKPEPVKYPLNYEINQGVGACYILTAEFFRQHQELFFPSFLYCEEATLSWQVRKSGGKLVYNSSLKVDHAESASLSKLPSRKTYEFGRDSYWIIRQYLFE